MSGYSLFREIIPNQSDTVSLPNIVANQPTKIAVLTRDDTTFKPFLKVNNLSSVEVASGFSFINTNGDVVGEFATVPPSVGGTLTAIVQDERAGGATASRT